MSTARALAWGRLAKELQREIEAGTGSDVGGMALAVKRHVLGRMRVLYALAKTDIQRRAAAQARAARRGRHS